MRLSLREGFSWLQRIDYWRVSFRCFDRHEVGHLQAQCRRPQSQFPPFKRTQKQSLSLRCVRAKWWRSLPKVACPNPKVNRYEALGVPSSLDILEALFGKFKIFVSSPPSLSHVEFVASSIDPSPALPYLVPSRRGSPLALEALSPHHVSVLSNSLPRRVNRYG
jgi:hypothetical protein